MVGNAIRFDRRRAPLQFVPGRSARRLGAKGKIQEQSLRITSWSRL
jgi:hypothetical protein